jgi:nucleotide-binding universal stress UspA family protein
VVLGTRGRTKLKYILLGSTVERLLKEMPCSVLVVRPPEASAGTIPAGNAGQ